jgi:hypothetical protein
MGFLSGKSAIGAGNYFIFARFAAVGSYPLADAFT